MKYDLEMKFGEIQEEYCFSGVAKQANGSTWLKSGNTVILASVVVDETSLVRDDFLPLTVQYIEKTYASGKIPGGFFKRETKPSDFETLTSRIIDRSLRPLFPKSFGYTTQITIIVFSADSDSDLQVLALKAASSALFVSDIDINIAVSAMRVAKIDDNIVTNPTLPELKQSTLDLLLCGTKNDLLMIEMHSNGDDLDSLRISNAIGEDELIDILELVQSKLFEQNARYETDFSRYTKPCIQLDKRVHLIDKEMYEYVKDNCKEDIENAVNEMAKSERSIALRVLRKKILETKKDWCEVDLKDSIEKVKTEFVRFQILDSGVRADGRGSRDIRDISISTNVLPNAHSSCLFTRGQTQALVVLTIGGAKDAQMFEKLTDSSTQNENFMVHYNFPSFSVGEASPITGVKRRELGHGNLAKLALEPIVDLKGSTIRLVSEILESNGSSSMATVCGGYMALKAADIEISDAVAGIAMGMVSKDDKYIILSDITGLEDHDGDLDFKVTGSKDGITAMQMDIKLGGISLDVLKEALYQAKEGRVHIIDIMLDAEKNISFNDGILPSTDFFSINHSSIGDIIGQSGRNIRDITEKFEVDIDIDKKQGKVKITGKNKQGVRGAREYIDNIINNPKISKIKYEQGDKHEGIVKRIVDFGAFVELPDGTDGLLHISKIKVSDALKEGDKITVEILEFRSNKISLGMI